MNAALLLLSVTAPTDPFDCQINGVLEWSQGGSIDKCSPLSAVTDLIMQAQTGIRTQDVDIVKDSFCDTGILLNSILGNQTQRVAPDQTAYKASPDSYPESTCGIPQGDFISNADGSLLQYQSFLAPSFTATCLSSEVRHIVMTCELAWASVYGTHTIKLNPGDVPAVVQAQESWVLKRTSPSSSWCVQAVTFIDAVNHTAFGQPGPTTFGSNETTNLAL